MELSTAPAWLPRALARPDSRHVPPDAHGSQHDDFYSFAAPAAVARVVAGRPSPKVAAASHADAAIDKA